MDLLFVLFFYFFDLRPGIPEELDFLPSNGEHRSRPTGRLVCCLAILRGGGTTLI